MPRDGSHTYHLPPGTQGIPDTTIESTKYNAFTADVEQDLNVPRPIEHGGTGATNAHDAMVALNGEVSNQLVDNYDSFLFVSGSFVSGSGATSAPVAGHYFQGIAYGDATNMTLEARDFTAPHTKYVRSKNGGVWAAWTTDTAALDAAKVNRSGDTMTGNLVVQKPSPQVILNKPDTSTDASFLSALNGLGRWQLNMAYGAESGSNTGSNFALINYNDAGAPVQLPLAVNRATGNVNMTGSLTVGGTISTTGGMVQFLNTATYLKHDGTNFILQSGGLTINSNVLRASDIYLSGIAYSIRSDGTNTFIRHGTGGMFFSDGGQTRYTMSLDNSGNLTIAGNVTSVANVTTIADVNVGRYLHIGTTFPDYGLCYFGTSSYFEQSAGNMRWAGPGTFTIGSDLYGTGMAFKPGGGAWADSSDARIKNVLGDYAGGLDEILALHPKVFTFKGNDTREPPSNAAHTPQGEEQDTSAPVVPYQNSGHYKAATSGKEYIGLIAQEADPVMPEMVSNHTGYIDGQQTEILDLDTTPLVYALINAVKTLAARVDALEAARK